jgi:hypothetical protein
VPVDPRQEYTRRLDERRAQLAAAIRHHITIGNLRVVGLIAVAGAAYGAFARGWFSAWWMLLPAAVFFWIGGRLERAVQARARLERGVGFYERALARLDGHWAGTGVETGERFLDDEHLYARDLDLFGPGSLFELLSQARTPIGEETLADWLKRPAPPSVVRARQSAIVELAPRIDLREDLAVLGEDTRSGVHGEALAAWGEAPSRLGTTRTPAWLWLLSAAGLPAAAGALAWLASIMQLASFPPATLLAIQAYVVVMAMAGGTILGRFRSRTNAILHEVDRTVHDLHLLAGVLGRLEAERFTSDRLTAVRAALDTNGQPPSRRIAQLHTLAGLIDSRHHALVRLLTPVLLWDLHLAFAVERWRRHSGAAVRQWLTAVGEMEALSSLASYRFEHPGDVFPELSDGPPEFDAEVLGHPLLAETVAVRNDVRLTGALRVLVVSGSNMSGKSTLLRTVGINAVLAQAGAPVRAARLRLTPLDLGASIRVQDSLQAGVSRFYAEITRIGAIVRRAGEARALLFLVDELLHGTNSHDRRIGAHAIVRGLVERGAIGLVTTHDLALAQIVDELGGRAANVHFDDDIDEGRIHFDYRLRPGVVSKSNALALMRSVGLDV